jgi:2'-5' RNA ligase
VTAAKVALASEPLAYQRASPGTAIASEDVEPSQLPWPRRSFFVRDLLSRLGRRRFGAETALIVAVAAAHPAVDRIKRAYNRASPPDLPLHITLLYPFVPPQRIDETVDAQLREFFASRRAFRYRLDQIERFPRALYLVPRPAEPFVAITRDIVRRWPAYQPYAGQVAEVVPHVTIATRRVPQAEIDALSAVLPLEVAADQAQLLRLAPGGGWSLMRAYAFGV